MASNHAAAAKAIRDELKRLDLKCKVTSKCYSGGTSITARVYADLPPKGRDAIIDFANQYQYGNFNGMTDSYEYSNKQTDLPQVKFVFVEFEYSDEIKQAVKEYIDNINGIPEYDRQRYYYMALNGSWGNFWENRA